MTRLARSRASGSRPPGAAALARAAPLTALLALFGGGSVSAHDVWIEPAAFRIDLGWPVAVRLMLGEDTGPEPLARNAARIVRFEIAGPSGAEALLGIDGADPAGYARPREAGLYAIVYQGNDAWNELPAVAFERYLAEEGLESVIAERERRGERQHPGREAYSRSLKSLVIAGEVEAARDLARGLPLELVLESDLAARAGSVSLQLLLGGKPLAGALVKAVPLGKDAPASTQRSDAEGRLSFDLTPGAWRVTAVHMERATEDRADWRSIWTSLTFDWGAAPASAAAASR